LRAKNIEYEKTWIKEPIVEGSKEIIEYDIHYKQSQESYRKIIIQEVTLED
jgi:hypothetical protein